MNNNITLQTLTPLHIGSGNEYAGNFEFLYFSQEQKIVIVDEYKLINIIGTENIDEWIKIIDRKQDLYKFLKSYKPDLKIKDISKKIIDAKNLPNHSQAIKQFMQDGMGRNYVAGSSLKGAIRTALLTYLIKKEPQFVIKNYNDFRFKDGNMVKHFLGTDPNHDILRLLQVGDFYSNNENLETECLKSGIMNLVDNNWKYKQAQYGFVECVPTHTDAKGTIKINEVLKKVIVEKERNTFLTQYFQHLTLPNLFKIINEHTKNLVESELIFWEDENINDDIEEYLGVLEDIKTKLQQIENKEKQCILRLGAGSGWDFMTGGWAKAKDEKGEYILEEYTWNELKSKIRDKPRKNKIYGKDLVFPKTRKLSNNQPLGFVKLSY